jgi:PIN domain nuclease of toxin-antitoxin system
MRALLDTHAFVWWIEEDSHLSARAREVIGSTDNQIVLSTLSGWEIVLKSSILRERRNDLPAYINAPNRIESVRDAAAHADPCAAHRVTAGSSHKDPFDRALIAQAQAERIPILSADRMIARYPVEVIW